MVSDLRRSFQDRHPEFPWIEAGKTSLVESLLQRLGWIDADEFVTSAEKAGEGNMNLTLRVRTSRRSLILKQARPWVEKYDHIAAPWDRVLAEAAFYERVSRESGLAGLMPLLLGADAETRILLLEDLTPSTDMTDLYCGAPLEPSTIEPLAAFLNRLHGRTLGESNPRFRNVEMRQLNHAHIFELPLTGDLDLPLDNYEPGLNAAAEELKRDSAFAARVRETGERYLADGACLVHGDYFPGSWLRTEAGPKIIDPEFCFPGDPEFDLGVAVAHFALARRPVDEARKFVRLAAGPECESRWIARYASAEVMRRLIGVAQLPIEPTEGWRTEMLKRSKWTSESEEWEALWN